MSPLTTHKRSFLWFMLIFWLTNPLSIVAQNKYNILCVDDEDSIKVSASCTFDDELSQANYLLLSSQCEIKHTNIAGFLRKEDTLYFKQGVKELNIEYVMPKYYYTDSAICLRRENNWYPHRNGELLTATVDVITEGTSNYVISGERITNNSYYTDTAYEIHLIILPKDRFTPITKESSVRPHIFYRSNLDTTLHDDAYYNEFITSYEFYSSFFGDSLSREPMNIIEIRDPQFMLCQSLQGVILFGGYFYEIYSMIPYFSWIPHEVSHQWWGNRVFFEHLDYALGESLNEYIKLQFLKKRGTGYEEQMEYYKMMIEQATEQLPIAEIHSLEDMNKSIAIYHAAPYNLEQMESKEVYAILRQLYRKHKNTLVKRKTFEQECGVLIDWLTPSKNKQP